MGNKVSSILLWIVRSLVLLLWLILILTFFAHKLTIPWHTDAPGVGGIVLSALPFILLFAAVTIVLARLLKRPVEAFVLVVLLISGPFLLAIPYPETGVRYSADDLALPPDVEASSGTLMRYTMDTESIPSSGLDADIRQLSGTWTNLVPYREEIEQAWEEFEAGRQYINDLNKFPGIGRPYEPVISSEHKTHFTYTLLREAAQLYALHAVLQVQAGRTAEGIQDLAIIHSVAMKALPYQNALVEKMVFASVASINIRAAYQIVRHGDCTDEELKLLLDHYPALEVRHTSMKRPITGELLFMLSLKDVMVEASSDSGNPPFRSLLFDHNQTIAEFQSLLDETLSELDAHPWKLFEEDMPQPLWARVEYAWLYPRNVASHFLYAIGSPSYAKLSQYLIKVKVQSDLLALELQRRLNRSLELKDIYGEEPYRYDEEHQQCFSVGPDGKPLTEDDIYIEKQCGR